MASYSGADLIDPDPPLNLAAPARVDELHSVRPPTLVIHGEQEMQFIKLTADALTDSIPDVRRVIVPGGGHAVNWNEPERFASEVLGFLFEVERRTKSN